MNKRLEQLLSVPKSLYVSFRLFPLKEAIKIPVLCRYNVRCLSLKGAIVHGFGGVRTGMLQIGFGQVGVFDKKYQRSILQIDGTIHLQAENDVMGKYNIGHGSRICVMKDGHLYIGAHFSNTAEMTIICSKEIRFGEKVTTSWNTLVMDTDFHQIVNLETGHRYPAQKSIVVGDHVWLCTRSVILKGAYIPNGCIVGAGAVVNKKFVEENSVLAGNPAMCRKTAITMIRE